MSKLEDDVPKQAGKLRLPLLELLILIVLKEERDGWDIAHEICHITDGEMSTSPKNISGKLKRMEGKGYLISNVYEDIGHRRRRFWRRTEEGIARIKKFSDLIAKSL